MQSSAACACLGAAFHRRPCCTWPKPWPTPGTLPTGASALRRQKSISRLMRARKEKAIANLTGGLKQLAAKRNVQVIRAKASFEDSNTLKLASPGRQALGRRPAAVRSLHNRHRIQSGNHSRFKPAHASGNGFHRRPGPARRARVASGRRRRIHRPGNGHGLRRAGKQSYRGRTYRRPAARRRSRPGQTAAQKTRNPVGGHLFEYKSGRA